jgi:ubiquinone/menaquinone biosynthesis C-methylase UbiE
MSIRASFGKVLKFLCVLEFYHDFMIAISDDTYLKATLTYPATWSRLVPSGLAYGEVMTDFHGDEANQQHHGHHHHGHQHGDFSSAETVDMLDVEGEALQGYWDDALSWIRRSADGAPRQRLLDLGAGTGTGALGLARHFVTAEVVAIDVAPDSLRRLHDKAVERGLAQRVSGVEADLDAGWPDLGTFDLTLASMSLHHMADPSRVLRDVLAATRPGGLIAVAEFSEPLRFLPDDLGIGTPGFEDRLIAAVSPAVREEMPTLGSAWAPRMAEAGWVLLEEREFRIDQNPPEHPSANRYARASFARLSHADADSLGPEDRATLAMLLDDDSDHSLLRRKDLHIRGVRTITLARRG